MNTGWANRLRRIGGASALGVMLMLTVGCQFKGGGTSGRGEPMTDYWQPQPASLRVYPATRFAQAERGSILEARIELRDEMGDAVKAAGRVGLELLAAERDGDTFDQQLYRWDVSMQSLEDQQTYFDSVTRTYLFRLELDPAVTRRPTTLRVTFTNASDGRRLQAEAPMPLR